MEMLLTWDGFFFVAAYKMLTGDVVAKLVWLITSYLPTTPLPLQIVIIDCLTKAVIKIDNHNREYNGCLAVTPVHSALVQWAVMSNSHLMVRKVVNNNYVKPDVSLGTSRMDLVNFHFFSAQILISQRQWDRASEFLGIAMTIPTKRIELGSYAFKNWLLVNAIRHGRELPLSSFISDENKHHWMKSGVLYSKFVSKYTANTTNQVDLINFLDQHQRDFQTDYTLPLVAKCLEKHKERYIDSLLKKAFVSMDLSLVDPCQLGISQEQVEDVVIGLILCGRVTGCKIAQGRGATIVSCGPTFEDAGEYTGKLCRLISDVMHRNHQMDEVSREIVKSGKFVQALAPKRTRGRGSDKHFRLGGRLGDMDDDEVLRHRRDLRIMKRKQGPEPFQKDLSESGSESEKEFPMVY
jgi:hypothetical protein